MDKMETNGYEVKIDYTIGDVKGQTVQDETRKSDNCTVRFCDFIVARTGLSLTRDPRAVDFAQIQPELDFYRVVYYLIIMFKL